MIRLPQIRFGLFGVFSRKGIAKFGWVRRLAHNTTCNIHDPGYVDPILVAKLSAGVTPEVNLRNPLHTHDDCIQARDPP